MIKYFGQLSKKENKQVPNIKSAKKRVLVNEKKNLENRMIRSEVKTAVKKFNNAIDTNNLELAEQLLPSTMSVIDRACSKGVIHKNNAANKKSALSKRLSDVKSGKVEIVIKKDNKTLAAEKAREAQKAREAVKAENQRKAAERAAQKEAEQKAKEEAEKAAKKATKKAAPKKDKNEEAAAPKKTAAKKTATKKAADEETAATKKPAAKKTAAKKEDGEAPAPKKTTARKSTKKAEATEEKAE